MLIRAVSLATKYPGCLQNVALQRHFDILQRHFDILQRHIDIWQRHMTSGSVRTRKYFTLKAAFCPMLNKIKCRDNLKVRFKLGTK